MRRPKKTIETETEQSIFAFPQAVIQQSKKFTNHLYFGDCLEVLQDLSNHDPFIDLIYIDPPFNSKRNYNVLFESINLKDSTAQKQAFADTWSNVMYIIELNNLAELNKDLFDFLNFLDKSHSVSDSAVAYLTTMAIRIWYMHKLLKDTGSFYLHCDPTMSHYLKLLCDMIFEEKNFQNEIIWQRVNAKGNVQRKFGSVHDIILRYTKKAGREIWNQQFIPLSEDYIEQSYRYIDEKTGRRYRMDNLTASMQRASKGQLYEWKGVKPPSSRCWVYAKDKMEELEKAGRIIYSKNGFPNYKRYLDENKGEKISDTWIDIPQIATKEFLGYPTQKPEALLERIIKASSNEDDVIADFFCGCGTTVAAAQKLKRRWLGADISHLAIKLILERLEKAHGKTAIENVRLHGFPKDVDSAKMLARETENGRFGFQEWVIEVLLQGVVNPKKTADGGYDGYLTYQTDKGKEFVLIETKSGGVNVKNVREFIQVINKQNAAAGIFVCFEETVTREMVKEAKAAGTITIEEYKTGIDKIQILTVDDILNNGKQPHLPNVVTTFKIAEKVKPTVKSGALF